MTEDLMGDAPDLAARLAPEKVSPAIVWLCTDEASKITGRQFCITGNRVSLLSWQVDVIADKDALDEPWTVAEIGEVIASSVDNWPKLLKPMAV
jgi:hypothetical protein